MVDKITLVKGDTGPPLYVTLTNEADGRAIRLTGCSVDLHFREVGAETDRAVLAATLTNPEAGEISFNWLDDPNALAGEPGPYEGEIRVTFPDTVVQTVYDVLKFWVRG